MELLNAGVVPLARNKIFDGIPAARMILGIILGRTQVNPRSPTRTGIGLAVASGCFFLRRLVGGGLVGGSLVRRILRPRKSRRQRQRNYQKSDSHPSIVSLQSREETRQVAG